MPGFGSRCLICAIVMMLACTSATKARSWRYYGYHLHWYGHSWSNPNRGNDEKRGDESRAEDKSDLRNRVGDFGSAIERLIRACDQQVVELKKMPLDSVTQIVKPAEDQRQALEQIQSVALSSAETLATNCPKKLPEGLTERLAILSHTLEAMAASLGVLHPTFTIFYGLLNDEQKARLVAMGIARPNRCSRGGPMEARAQSL
jgi:LTXXQ motif family protein